MNDDIISNKKEFRIRIIAALLYTDWMTRYGAIIKPEFFPSDAEKTLVHFINQHHMMYSQAPDEEEIKHHFTDIRRNALVDYTLLMGGIDFSGALSLLVEVENVDDSGLDYAMDVAMDFARVQAMKLAILESVDAMQGGDLQKPMELVRDALQVGTDRLALGLDLVEDVTDWVYEELHGRRFPTGIIRVDEILGGGMAAGEYGLIMAPPGRGKSTTLINIGAALAGLIGAANVLNVTYEMPAQKYLRRYAKRVSGLDLRRGDGGEASFIRNFRKRASQRLKGKLRVVRPDDYTVDGIRRLIDMLAVEGFVTEALIVDYPDLMRPVRKRNELRFELADIARDLRELGAEYEMPVWGGTQAGRQAIYKEIIGIQDIAEALEKAAIADVVISICQTREEEQLGHGRLFMAKIRDAEDHFAIPIKLDFENQSITQRKALDVALS